MVMDNFELKPISIKNKDEEREWRQSKPPYTEEDLKDVGGKPKMLFAAIKSPMFDGQFMAEGFEQAGYDVSIMNWQHIRFTEGDEGLNDRIVSKVKMDHPEITFLHIQSPGVLFEDPLREIKERTFTIIYTFDVRTDINWLKKLAPHVGLILFSDKESIRQCNADGILNVGYLPPAADYRLYRKLDMKAVTSEYGEVVFIGNNYINSPHLGFEKAEERVAMVEFMKKNFGDRFKAFGLGWGNSIEGTEIIYPHNEVLIYNSAKVAITHNHFLRSGYQSDRMYRSIGCGCYTVGQYFPGINQQFNANVCSTWIDFDMLGEEVEKALSNYNLRKLVSEAGAEFARKFHSWKNRAEEVNLLIEQEKRRVSYGVGMAD